MSNPNSPTLVGEEWMADTERGLRVSEAQAQAVRFNPGVITIDDFLALFVNVADDPTLFVEIVPEAHAIPDRATTLDDFVPTSDVYQSPLSSFRHASTLTGLPLYVDVDESVLNTADFVYSSQFGPGGGNLLTFGFTTGAYASTKRVTAVTVRAWCGVDPTGSGTDRVTFTPTLRIGGVEYADPAHQRVLAVADGVVEIDGVWYFNPATGLPWTTADIVAFSTGQSAGINWTSATVAGRLYQLGLRLTSITESRALVGSFTPVEGVVSVVSMTTPAGADTAAVAAGSYLAVVSNPSGVGAASWKAIDAASGHPDFSSCPVTYDDSGVITAIGATDTAAPTFAVTSSTGALLAGQPFSVMHDIPVYAGATLLADVVLPDAQSRGSLASVVAQASAGTVADLVEKLKVGGVQVGGSVTVTETEVRRYPRRRQRVWLPMAASGVGSATTFQVEWSSTALTADVGWLVAALGLDDPAVELLTLVQRSLETGVTGWAAGANAAVAQSAAQASDGFSSLALTSTSGTGTRSATTPTGVSGIPVTPGTLLTASAMVRSTVARTHSLVVTYYSAGGGFVGAGNVYAPSVVSTTTGFTRISYSSVVPATAVFAALEWDVQGVAAGETHYGDAFSLVRHSPLAGLVGANAYPAGVIDFGLHVPVVVGKAIAAPASLVAVAA